MHFVHKTGKLGTIFPAYKNLSPKSGHNVPRGSFCSRCSTNSFLGTAKSRVGKLALVSVIMHFVHKTGKLGTIFPAYKNQSPKSGQIVPRGSLCSRCSTHPFLGTANPRVGKLALVTVIMHFVHKTGKHGTIFPANKNLSPNSGHFVPRCPLCSRCSTRPFLGTA